MVHAIVLVIVLSANIARIQAALPIFNIVRFPNDACNGGTKNGTCYTKQECSSLGGTSSKDCAEGFGVCCIFSLSCGQTSSQNSTYLAKTSFTTLTEQCVYHICPTSTSICRIRFDVTSMVLTDNHLHTVASTPTVPAGLNNMVGGCMKDSFQITGAKSSSPVICGSNMNGQHMILDVDEGSCLTVSPFIFSGDTTTSRSWDMTVTQFLCTDQDVAGPPSCLQYFTGTTGNLRDFKMPSTIVASSSAGALGTTAVGSSQTHLKNQDYNICIRRASTACRICYHAVRKGTTTITDQSSFGLSVDTAIAATAQAATNSDCYGDYLGFPNLLISTTCTTLANCQAVSAATYFRQCGRYFGTDNGVITGVTLCTTQLPFNIRVHFDDYEGITTATASIVSEGSVAPSGNIGFALYYKQDCF